MSEISQQHKNRIIETLFPLRGHFGTPTGDKVEGVVFSCVDPRVQEETNLHLGGRYYHSRTPGANIPPAKPVPDPGTEIAMRLGLTGGVSEGPPPRHLVILGHEDCKAALGAIQNQRTVKKDPAIAQLFEGKVHPGMMEALKTVRVKGTNWDGLHREMIRTTVLSSMQNAMRYALGGSEVGAWMEDGAARIVGGIRGLSAQPDGKLPLDVYAAHTADFMPVEALYHAAIGGNAQSAGEIEEHMARLTKGGKTRVQLGAAQFLSELGAGIRQEITRIHGLGSAIR